MTQAANAGKINTIIVKDLFRLGRHKIQTALYTDYLRQRDIARKLNRLGRKTPALLRAERYGEEFYSSRKSKTGQFAWSYVSVKNVLAEEGYAGVPINHRTETRCSKVKRIGQDRWIRHEDFCPSHRIRETELDFRVQQYAEKLRHQWTAEQADLRRLQRLWEMKRPAINAHIADLYEEIQRLEQEIDDLLLEKIQSGS